MKSALFLLIFSPALALAAEPTYEVPGGATHSSVACARTETSRALVNGAWTDWQITETKENFGRDFWLTDAGTATLDTGEGRVKFTQMTEVSSSPRRIERLERVEDWTLSGGDWTLEPYTVRVTILRRLGTPNVREEQKNDGPVLRWEASTEESTVTKKLLNPEALNSEVRQVSALDEICDF
jgi:hypothetical protein